MAEYLSPGVYVEEFDSGGKAMEGVSTSTAGFIGMTQRGPTIGKPVLITSVAHYTQIFGGHLGIHYPRRYTSYGIEQFFANGGSSCYVMRVVNESDQGASAFIGKEITREVKKDETTYSEKHQLGLSFQATSVGDWGNACKVSLQKIDLTKTEVTKVECIETDVQGEETKHIVSTSGIVRNANGFYVGDLVKILTEATIVTKTESKDTIEVKTYEQTNVICAILEQQLTWKKNVLPAELTTKEMQEKVNAGTINITCTHRMVRLGCKIQVQCDAYLESYDVSFQPEANDYMYKAMAKSYFVIPCLNLDHEAMDETYLDLEGWYQQCLYETAQSYYLQGGTSSTDDTGIYQGVDAGPGKRTGIASFMEVDDVSMMLMPGVVELDAQLALIAHCEHTTSRFAILDMPSDLDTVSGLQEHRENFDTSYAAIYHPWLTMQDSLQKKNVNFPPSAAMAGIYARVDTTRGVNKAPANEVIKNCTGLSVNFHEAEQAKLNPKGINVIRAIPGQGIRIWGARTMSSDSNWKYINVRRLFIYLEQSIYHNTGWAVFEPNDANLWKRVESSIHMFLNTMWRNGALTGSSEEEAFFINIGTSTMSQDDIQNGRLICVIGIAPVRPAEFVIFRITQKMQDAA